MSNSDEEETKWNNVLDDEEKKLEYAETVSNRYRIIIHELDFPFDKTFSNFKQATSHLHSLLDQFNIYRSTKISSIQRHYSDIELQVQKITHKTRRLIFDFLPRDDPLHQCQKSQLKLNDCKQLVLKRLEQDCNSQLSQLKHCLSRFTTLLSEYEMLHKQLIDLQTDLWPKRQKAEKLTGLSWKELVAWCTHPELQSYPVFDPLTMPPCWINQGMQLVGSHSSCFQIGKRNGVREVYRITHVASHYLRHHFFSGLQLNDIQFDLPGRLAYGQKILNLMTTHFNFSVQNVLIKNKENDIISIIRYTRGDLPFLLACTFLYFSQGQQTAIEVLPCLRDVWPLYQQKQLHLISEALQFHDHRAISALFSGYLIE
jgi:hypothetical protein